MYVNLEDDLWVIGSQSQGAEAMVALVRFFFIGWKPEILIYPAILVINNGGKKKCIQTFSKRI